MGAGWQVRGTTRDPGNAEDILAAGLEAVVADPNLPASILDQVGDVTVVFWLLGSAQSEAGEGGEEAIAVIHGTRLERLLEKLVDTPVRGFVYEATGTVDPVLLERGAEAVNVASERWRIPVTVFEASPADLPTWVDAAVQAATNLTH